MSWRTSVAFAAPASAAVTVWRASTPPAAAARLELAASLAPAEAERLAAITHQGRADEFLVGRWLLRGVLGATLGTLPRDVPIEPDEHGKLRACAAPGLGFNLSHSAGIVVLALCPGRVIGVDVETLRTVERARNIARRFFSTAEFAALERSPPRRFDRTFFTCWVRKECLVKAHGTGIAGGLAHFDVNVSPAEPPRLVAARTEAFRPDRWLLRSLPLADPHLGCIAVNAGPELRLECREAPRTGL